MYPMVLRDIVLDPRTKVRPKDPKFPKCYLSTLVRKRQNIPLQSIAEGGGLSREMYKKHITAIQ